MEELFNVFCKCLVKASEDFTNGKPVDEKSLYAIQEGIRVLHHLDKIMKNNPQNNDSAD